MDQQQQTTSSTPSTTTPPAAASSSSVSEPPQQPPSQSQPLQQQLPQNITPSTSSSSSNPNPNSIQKPLSAITPAQQTPQQPPQTLAPPSLLRPASANTPSLSRPWQHPQFSHFSSSPSVSSSTSPSISGPQRGGIAVGVPAAHPNPSSPLPSPSQSTPFSGSFGQHFGSASNSNAAQARQPMPGMQGMGMVGSLGSSSQLRPGGISAHHQQRPVQTPLRPTSSPNSPSTATQRPVRASLVPQSSQNSQSSATQNFQGHGFMRMSAVASPGSPAPSTSQSIQPLNQPWLSAGSQGKPPLPPPSFRPQSSSPSLQQRSHIQHHSLPAVSQQQHLPSSQPQQPQSPHQQQDHYGQQFPQSRVHQSLPHQHQIPRAQASASQKPSSLAIVQPNAIQPGMQSRMGNAEIDESGGRILSKRSIHELVSQIDPSERLDPEVEDILVDIAEDFVDSITTFGCQLAKHRKSDTLEAKDILVHLDRNWNMTLPGFSGDEIKTYKKPLITEIHKERLAVIKKSISASEAPNARNIVGHAASNAKVNLGKMPSNFLGSPNLKTREVT